MLKIRQASIRRIDTLIRFCLSSGIFIGLITQSFVILVLFIIIFGLIALYEYNISKKQSGLAWDVLVEKDLNRMHLFYRMASMFVDVPHLKAKIKHRKLLRSEERRVGKERR